MDGTARPRLIGGLGVLCLIALAVSVTAQDRSPPVPPDCERGILDDGESGMNVLVYQLCADRLIVGFRNSDVIEEISCGPAGAIRLWMLTHHDRCDTQPAADTEQVYDILEPLRGVGGKTTEPIAKRLRCGDGTMNRATVVVPHARAALLETRTGDTRYERVTRRFISHCVRPGV